jgi:hypothetical protein
MKDLFRDEARRLDAVTVALRKLVSTLPHRPMSAWIDGTPDDGRNTDTFRLYFVARPEELEGATDFLSAHLTDIERKHDVHVVVHGLTRSELANALDKRTTGDDGVRLIGGVPPTAFLERPQSALHPPSITSHDEHDARTRKLALALATKLKADPGLLAVAADRVKRRAIEASARERRELAEWNRILSTMSPARLQRFLVEDSERAVRLRQSLPALNLLSPAEREAVLRSRTDADVIAAINRR